jgi:hypothetical protein
VRSHKPYFQRLTLTETAEVDTHSSVMNEAGDKMVTTQETAQNPRPQKGTGKRGPCATVKFGSAVVPIYRTESKGRMRSSEPPTSTWPA